MSLGAGFNAYAFNPQGLPKVDPSKLDANTEKNGFQDGEFFDIYNDDPNLLNENQEIFKDPETGRFLVRPSVTKAAANQILTNAVDPATLALAVESIQPQRGIENAREMIQQDAVLFNEKTVNTAGDDKEVIHTYPSELGLSPELKNWISFEIFISGGNNLKTNTDSKSDANPRVYGVDIKQLSKIPGVNPEKVANFLNSPSGAVTTLGTLGAGTGSLLISGIGAQVAKDLWNNFSYEGSDKTGAGEFGFVQETTGMTTANVRVPRTICLYMPTNLKTSYGVEYNDEDFTKLGMLTSSAKVTAQTLANMLKGRGVNDEHAAAQIRATMQYLGEQALKSSSDYFGQMIENVSKGLGGDYNLANYYKAVQRRVTNPFIINMYKSTKRRTFDFSFKFLPRSAKEVETVYQIINLFKRYSLPKRIGGLAGRFVEYPAEFRIRFNHDGLENLYLPRIGRCSLTDINVVYGDEVFSTFAPVSAQTQRGEIVGGAAPTKIEMTLSFTELEILTADRIEQGF
jgi:hypothetical protein